MTSDLDDLLIPGDDEEIDASEIDLDIDASQVEVDLDDIDIDLDDLGDDLAIEDEEEADLNSIEIEEVSAVDIEQRRMEFQQATKILQKAEGMSIVKPNPFRVDLEDLFGEEEGGMDALDVILSESPTLTLGTGESQNLIGYEEHKQEQLRIGTANTEEAPVEQKYEIALTPKQQMLALIDDKKEEGRRINETNKDIHALIHGLHLKSDQFEEQLVRHLDTPAYNILPKNVIFRGAARKYKSFRYLLKSLFWEKKDSPQDLDVEETVKLIKSLWEDSMKGSPLTETILEKIAGTVKAFFSYARDAYTLHLREMERMEYQADDDDDEFDVPELITSTHYLCSCGAEVPMHGDRPTLCYLIHCQEVGQYTVLFPNEKVTCGRCGTHLALATQVAEEILKAGIKYVRDLNVTVEYTCYYRPPIKELMKMIPSNLHDMFQLEVDKSVDLDNFVSSSKGAGNASSRYRLLINHWMEPLYAKYINKQLTDKITLTDRTKFAMNVASRLPLTNLINLESFQFTKTLLMYLEDFGLFQITEKAKAKALVLEREELNSKRFSDDYAIDWLFKHAPLLVGLVNRFSDTVIEPLGIRPEYTDVITYICTLRLIAKQEHLAPKSYFRKLLNKPSSYEPRKFADRLILNHNLPEWMLYPESLRDLKQDNSFYPIDVWSSYYHFTMQLLRPEVDNKGLKGIAGELVSEIRFVTFKQFYQTESEHKDYLEPPAYDFDRLTKVFMDYGYLLFKGVIIDKKTIHLASLVAALLNYAPSLVDRELDVNTGASNDMTKVIPLETDFEGYEPKQWRALKVLEYALAIGDIPEPYNSLRIELGEEPLNIEAILGDPADLIESPKFYGRYKEELECFLPQSTTAH